MAAKKSSGSPVLVKATPKKESKVQRVGRKATSKSQDVSCACGGVISHVLYGTMKHNRMRYVCTTCGKDGPCRR